MPSKKAEEILESLASDHELLWPGENWPPMQLDKGLVVGSSGGHSMIRYRVSEHVPGKRVEFEFEPMPHLQRFQGRHYFEVVTRGRELAFRHVIDVSTNLKTWIYWKIFVEHIHDAVIEDAFDKIERVAGLPRPHRSHWSLHVRILRRWRRRAMQHASSPAV